MQQTRIFTRRGVDRILRYAFELASTRPGKHVTSATKSNGMSIAMPFWDERFAAMAAHYPDIRIDQYHIDILTAHFVQQPRPVRRGGGLQPFRRHSLRPGTGLHRHDRHRALGQPQPRARISVDVRAGARLGPRHLGRNIANPIGQIWSGPMMLDHLGHKDAAAAVVRAIETVLTEGPRTPDIGGTASTQELGKAIAEASDQALPGLQAGSQRKSHSAPDQRLSQGDGRRTDQPPSRRLKTHAQAHHHYGHVALFTGSAVAQTDYPRGRSP